MTITTHPADENGANDRPTARLTASRNITRRHLPDLVTAPRCTRCGTDRYLYIEGFVPAAVRDNGDLSRLGEASYFCTRCLEYSAHAVPPLWTPPRLQP